MLIYTPDEIFDLLGSVSCETDLIEIEHYIMTNEKWYAWYDLRLFYQGVEILEGVFV